MYTLLKHIMPVIKIHTSIRLHWLKTSMVSFNGEWINCFVFKRLFDCV